MRQKRLHERPAGGKEISKSGCQWPSGALEAQVSSCRKSKIGRDDPKETKLVAAKNRANLVRQIAGIGALPKISQRFEESQVFVA